MKALVTGGAGFVGANLCRTLAARGVDTVVLDDLSSGSPDNLAGIPVELVTGSVLDTGLLTRLMTGAEAVVHLAAIPSVPRSIAQPVPSHEANATGTLRVLEAARSTGAHVIVASSSSVYGSNPALPKTEGLVCRPMSPYAVSKLAAESYAIAYQQCYQVPTLAFRFFNIYGPLQAADHAYAAVVPAMVSAALEGRPLRIFGDGMQSRDFTFVDSVTRLICDAVDRRVVSETPVNLAFGTRTTLLELVHALSAVLGRTLALEHVAPRPGDVRHSQADTGLLTRLFPDAAPVGLEEGLAATVDWFRRTGAGSHIR